MDCQEEFDECPTSDAPNSDPIQAIIQQVPEAHREYLRLRQYPFVQRFRQIGRWFAVPSSLQFLVMGGNFSLTLFNFDDQRVNLSMSKGAWLVSGIFGGISFGVNIPISMDAMEYSFELIGIILYEIAVLHRLPTQVSVMQLIAATPLAAATVAPAVGVSDHALDNFPNWMRLTNDTNNGLLMFCLRFYGTLFFLENIQTTLGLNKDAVILDYFIDLIRQLKADLENSSSEDEINNEELAVAPRTMNELRGKVDGIFKRISNSGRNTANYDTEIFLECTRELCPLIEALLSEKVISVKPKPSGLERTATAGYKALWAMGIPLIVGAVMWHYSYLSWESMGAVSSTLLWGKDILTTGLSFLSTAPSVLFYVNYNIIFGMVLLQVARMIKDYFCGVTEHDLSQFSEDIAALKEHDLTDFCKTILSRGLRGTAIFLVLLAIGISSFPSAFAAMKFFSAWWVIAGACIGAIGCNAMPTIRRIFMRYDPQDPEQFVDWMIDRLERLKSPAQAPVRRIVVQMVLELCQNLTAEVQGQYPGLLSEYEQVLQPGECAVTIGDDTPGETDTPPSLPTDHVHSYGPVAGGDIEMGEPAAEDTDHLVADNSADSGSYRIL